MEIDGQRIKDALDRSGIKQSQQIDIFNRLGVEMPKDAPVVLEITINGVKTLARAWNEKDWSIVLMSHLRGESFNRNWLKFFDATSIKTVIK